MGTINYKTSKYITLGIEPFECGEYYEDYQDDWNNIQHLLNNYSFDFFTVNLVPGYYEGFSLDIDPEFYEYFDDWREKQEALKEATQLKKLLLACVDCGLCEVWPGWCTSYKKRNESIEAIKEAIQEIKSDIKALPTWRNYTLR